MISLRTAARRLAVSRHHKALIPQLSKAMSSTSKDLAQVKEEEENNATRELLESDKSPVQKYVEKTREMDPHMVWGTTIAPPDPQLPVEESEIAALDPAHMNQDPLNLDTGEQRVVTIKQESANNSQAPLNLEKEWLISFQDDGELAHTWDNPLMGWVSSSDPLANSHRLQMQFRNAADAVYFAKKRGWSYVVDEPKVRKGRSDDAQYQDNFLSQAVAFRVRKERHDCDEWHRDEAGASHYFRPLKYHGDGVVPQHGPTGTADVAPHVDGSYKRR